MSSHGHVHIQIRCSQNTGARCVGIEINEERAKEAVQNIEAAGR
jgi:predicted O-methyltransferase YrrM